MAECFSLVHHVQLAGYDLANKSHKMVTVRNVDKSSINDISSLNI